MVDMSIETINILIAGSASFEDAFTRATNGLNDRMKAIVERQNKMVVNMTQSHSAGYVPGGGYFCSIIATLQF